MASTDIVKSKDKRVESDLSKVINNLENTIDLITKLHNEVDEWKARALRAEHLNSALKDQVKEYDRETNHWKQRALRSEKKMLINETTIHSTAHSNNSNNYPSDFLLLEMDVDSFPKLVSTDEDSNDSSTLHGTKVQMNHSFRDQNISERTMISRLSVDNSTAKFVSQSSSSMDILNSYLQLKGDFVAHNSNNSNIFRR